MRDAFDLGRNHYHRLGHFAQGFVPAILAGAMTALIVLGKPHDARLARLSGKA